jgi:hypothetical protein
MECKFNPPADVMAWTLIIVRAALMPVLSIDLSLAQPLAVGPKDMSYEAELASGRSVMRDLITAANNQTAPLAQKMALYCAAANMSSDDQQRLERMIDVVKQLPTSHLAHHASATPSSQAATAADQPEEDKTASMPDPEDVRQKTNQGPKRADMSSSKQRKSRDVLMPSTVANRQPDGGRSNVRTLPVGTGKSHVGPPARANAGRSLADTEELRKRRVLAAERIMSARSDIGPRGLARLIEEETDAPCSESTAQEIIMMIRARSA